MSNIIFDESTRVRGAIYVPSRAYNAYQSWRDYSHEETVRDIGYAARLNLNALRVWLSYEYWLENPKELEENFNDFLQTASARGIRIMPSLFECCGTEPTREALDDKNPLTAVCVHSPSLKVMEDSKQWGKPLEYLGWFMERFGNDQRNLTIELINEPHEAEMPFTKELFRFANQNRGSVPITCALNKFFEKEFYDELGIDIFNSHNQMNFIPSEEEARKNLQMDVDMGDLLGKEVYLSEWQRLRSGGWNNFSGDEWQPDYASLFYIVNSYPIGWFFWSLMIKPAYLRSQRKKAVLNGIFHEDGTVWSLADARAISGNPDFKAEERKEWPEWAKAIPEYYRK